MRSYWGTLILAFVVLFSCAVQSLALEVLTPPVLISPTNGSSVTEGPDHGILLQWGAVSGANTYEVSIEYTGPSAPFSLTTETTNTSWSNLYQLPGDWRWQVRAKTLPATFGPWSALWTYSRVVVTPTPTPEGFANPDLNGDDSMTYLDLLTFIESWKASSGDANYFYPADLDSDGKIDQKDLLQMSLAWKYRGLATIPSVTLTYPTSGATIKFSDAVISGLKWQALNGVQNYNVYIKSRTDEWPLVSDLVQGATYSFRSTVPGVYDWKVRGQDPKTLLLGPWSTLRSFTLTGTALSAQNGN